MLTVRAIRPFKRRGQVLKPGDTFDIDPANLEKMDGFVEPVDLHQLVTKTLADINRLGLPWAIDFLTTMPQDDRQRLRQLERDVDQAVLADDYPATIAALDAYKNLVLALKKWFDVHQQQQLFS